MSRNPEARGVERGSRSVNSVLVVTVEREGRAKINLARLEREEDDVVAGEVGEM